ncbi:response regulator [Aquitalea aquatica]|uniref:Response regulator n=1 Tax=Aquitalea aquatica TaxID=3044273 RepID=A0A838YIL7_9NEIS|nr:response regulator [Aquitalea magnusonii]MBA4710584.1 response regulator [Aquitalea magnusonii]
MNNSKIMIVEDDAISAILMRKWLAKSAHVHHCATPDAFQQTAFEVNPDIILMDINLGGDEDGFDLVTWYRSQQGKAQVIFISSYETAEILSRIYACGGNDYILKPPSLEVLENKIRHALEWRAMDAICPISPRDENC